MSFKVTAPLVTANVNGRVVYLYRDDAVPSDISDESLENLKSLGYVEDEDESADDKKPARKTAASSKSE